jgi:lysophospholipase L1-like esterase
VEQLEDRCVPAVTGGPPVVFVGDSITAWYQLYPAWQTTFGRAGAKDVGIPGLTTETLLSKINDGLLAGTSPRLVVLMIGTNDLTLGKSPEETASGVAACVTAIRASQPQAHILLLGILPSDQMPGTLKRQDTIITNALISGLDDHTTVSFVDIGSVFLQRDGTISPAVMPDFLHPSAYGYFLETAAIGNSAIALLSGARSVSVAFGPFGEVTEAVYPNGTLVQSDASGEHVLGGGVRAAAVAFGARGEQLIVLLTNGKLFQFDALGAHLLGTYPPS